MRRDRTGVDATGLLGKMGQFLTQRLKESKPGAHARQKETLGFPEAGSRRKSTELKNTLYQP